MRISGGDDITDTQDWLTWRHPLARRLYGIQSGLDTCNLNGPAITAAAEEVRARAGSWRAAAVGPNGPELEEHHRRPPFSISH